jgi:hypothetical protein
MFSGSAFAARYAQLHHFAGKILRTLETTMKSETLRRRYASKELIGDMLFKAAEGPLVPARTRVGLFPTREAQVSFRNSSSPNRDLDHSDHPPSYRP